MGLAFPPQHCKQQRGVTTRDCNNVYRRHSFFDIAYCTSICLNPKCIFSLYCRCSCEMHHCLYFVLVSHILYLHQCDNSVTAMDASADCWSTLHSRLILYSGVTALHCYSVTVVQCKSVTTVLQGKPVGLHAQVILCCGAKGQTFVIEAHFKCPEFKFVLYGKYSMKHQIFNTFTLFLPHRSKEGRSDGETLTFLSKASNCQLVQH